MTVPDREPILDVKGLHKQFPVYGPFGRLSGVRARVQAVTDVSFELREGETYGLVGESGSGKSTTARTLLGLTPATKGEVRYGKRNLTKLSREEWRAFRKEIQMVFQDPYSSLNPRKRIGTILEEPLEIHGLGDAAERKQQVFRILEIVGLRPEHYFRYPHEFSGGQRQRLGLARALIISPRIIVCDEPVSALDVSIQSQILNLLKDLQRDMKLTLLFITHDLSVVRHISDRIGVMYLGRLVEEAPTDGLFSEPLHPYTQALFSAVPDFTRGKLERRKPLQGEIPSPLNPPAGCVFHTRCPWAVDRCKREIPQMREVRPQHRVACHLVEEQADKNEPSLAP